MSGQPESEEKNRSAALRLAWDNCVHMLASKVSTVTLDSYIRSAQPVSWEGNVVTLGVVSSFAREWLEKKYANQVRSALEFHLDTSGLEVRFVVSSREAQPAAAGPRTTRPKPESLQTTLSLDTDDSPDAPLQMTPPPETPSSNSRSARRTVPAPKKNEIEPVPCLPLNDRYMFENFLEGRSNRFAKVSATAVASRPGEVYNPLFIHGGPGLGKSHLLQAIAQVIKRTRSGLGVAYISGEYFAQSYVNSIRDHATETFRRQYRRIDVWLVDDIQFIMGKEHCKEEFFHTFNALYQSGKQIVLASDRSPRELDMSDERLRSRFQSGLIADINAPDIETRIAFLQTCREREKVAISDDILFYIADAIQSNMRTMEGALTRLVAYSSIMSASITPELAQRVLREYFISKPIRTRRITIDAIVESVSECFNVKADAIKGASRIKDIVLARHVAMYLTRELLPEVNTTVVGAAFGGKDHSTILHACQRIRTLMEMDEELKAAVARLTNQLNQ